MLGLRGPCAHTSPGKPGGNVKHPGLSFQREGHITIFFFPEGWDLQLINSLVIHDICWTRPYQAPPPGPGDTE